MVSLLLGFVLAMWTLPSLWWFAPLLVVYIPLMGSLNGGTRGLTQLRQHQLDEREGRTRDASFSKVFWPVLAVVFLALFAIVNGGLSHETRKAIGLAATILVLTMPTLYLAWT